MQPVPPAEPSVTPKAGPVVLQLVRPGTIKPSESIELAAKGELFRSHVHPEQEPQAARPAHEPAEQAEQAWSDIDVKARS